MTIADTLELQLPNSSWLLSARRLLEFGEYGQLLNLPITSTTLAAHAIDVIDCSAGTYLLTGFTLHDVEQGKGPAGLDRRQTAFAAVRLLRAAVKERLLALQFAQAQRGGGEEFACIAFPGPLRVRGLYSRLQARLASAKGALPPAQWLATITNYTRSGITEEEIRLSGVREALSHYESSSRIPGRQVAQGCTFSSLQLSILSETSSARRQVQLVPAPQRTYRRVQGRQRLRQPGQRTTVWVDPSLGFRLDRIEHEALWGFDVSWQAVDEKGVPLSGGGGAQDGIEKQHAQEAAAHVAAMRFPKRVATPRWQHWCWGGGESYREWLVTAPGLPVGYFSAHFDVRNVLIHFRLDVRETASGQAVLFVQEVQSDWAQGAASSHPTGGSVGASRMPFAREWSLLAAKLLLLHAAALEVDQLAWTTGEQQVRRWAGLGERRLRRLYDELLPREFERLLGRRPDASSIYVPFDFTTRRVQDGYEIVGRDGRVLGCAATLDLAWQFLPDGAREDLVSVHSVALPAETRKMILSTGFPCWGIDPATASA